MVFRLGPYPKHANCSSVFRPCSLVADASVWATSPLRVVVRRVFCVFCFSSHLRCPLRFQNSPKIRRWEGFLVFGNLSFTIPSGMGLIPNSFLSLFVFYILSYLILKRMGFLSGCLVSSASVQKLFWGSCSIFKWSFDEFLVEKKVVSPSYSSAILGPPRIIL